MQPGPTCGPDRRPDRLDRDARRVDAAGDPRDQFVPERGGVRGRSVEDRERFERAGGQQLQHPLASLAPGPHAVRGLDLALDGP